MSSSGWCARWRPVPARPARDATGRWARAGRRLGGGVEAQREGAQAGVHAQAGAAHGGFEIIAREGQGAAAGATAPNRLALMTLPARSARSCRSKHMKRLAAARPASSTLFGSAMPLPGADFADRVAAVRGRDQHAAVVGRPGRAGWRGRLPSVRPPPPGPRRPAWASAPQARGRRVRRRPRAAVPGNRWWRRCAGPRPAPRWSAPPAGVLGHVDDPVGEHAAALAAHGQDGDLDRRGGARAAEVLMLLSMSEPQSASCARRAARRALQETDHRPAHAGQEPVAAGGVVDDVGAIERGAQHGGMGHFTAVAAAHAAAFHVRDRVFL